MSKLVKPPLRQVEEHDLVVNVRPFITNIKQYLVMGNSHKNVLLKFIMSGNYNVCFMRQNINILFIFLKKHEG